MQINQIQPTCNNVKSKANLTKQLNNNSTNNPSFKSLCPPPSPLTIIAIGLGIKATKLIAKGAKKVGESMSKTADKVLKKIGPLGD